MGDVYACTKIFCMETQRPYCKIMTREGSDELVYYGDYELEDENGFIISVSMSTSAIIIFNLI